jgi:hypothetical protein
MSLVTTKLRPDCTRQTRRRGFALNVLDGWALFQASSLSRRRLQSHYMSLRPWHPDCQSVSDTRAKDGARKASRSSHTCIVFVASLDVHH